MDYQGLTRHVMETVLFLAHTQSEGGLPGIAFESLQAAKTLTASLPDATLVAGLVGADTTVAANQLANCSAKRILTVSGPEFSSPRYASDALAIAALTSAAGASIIIAPATSRWNRVMAGAAQRLQGRVDTHITGLRVSDGSPLVTRWYYRQRMEAELRRQHRPWFLLIDAGCFEPWTAPAGTATTESLTVEVPAAARRTTVTGIRTPPASQQTIRPEAQLLFVAGAGWSKKQTDGRTHVKEAETLIVDFLNRAQASLGSSKSLVDLSGEGQDVLSCLTHLNQVGQTGSTPRHPKGLAACCHGEEPHTVGWRFIKERRAINLDPNCGWARGKADVLYVADAFAVMAKLNALLGPPKA